MQNKKSISVQEWIPFDKFLDKGIIKLKTNEYVKVLRVVPINYSLKSNLEKERNIKFL